MLILCLLFIVCDEMYIVAAALGQEAKTDVLYCTIGFVISFAASARKKYGGQQQIGNLHSAQPCARKIY